VSVLSTTRTVLQHLDMSVKHVVSVITPVLCCQELLNNIVPHHSTAFSSPNVTSPMPFSFGVQVHSTGLLYIPRVSYHSMESGFNCQHCVGELFAASK